jgi:hypothetical protein
MWFVFHSVASGINGLFGAVITWYWYSAKNATQLLTERATARSSHCALSAAINVLNAVLASLIRCLLASCAWLLVDLPFAFEVAIEFFPHWRNDKAPPTVPEALSDINGPLILAIAVYLVLVELQMRRDSARMQLQFCHPNLVPRVGGKHRYQQQIH